MKKIQFIFNGEMIHEVAAADLDTETICKFKSALAASRGIDCDLIEIANEDSLLDEKDRSDCFVRADGSLLYHPKKNTYPVVVSKPTAAMDINHAELEDEFIELISKGDIDNAIIFN